MFGLQKEKATLRETHALEPMVREAFEFVCTHNKYQMERILTDIPRLWWVHAVKAGERYDEFVREAEAFRLHFDRICAPMAFSHDWFSDKLWSWHEILAPYRDSNVRILEVGAFEGRSVVFLAEYLPKSLIVAIDYFAIKKGWTSTQGITLSQDTEISFDHNVLSYGDRIRKIPMESARGLSLLVAERAKFEIIYIDASHTAGDVLADALLAWRLLEIGGLMIFDDFLLDVCHWDEGPVGPGVIWFLKIVSGSYDWVHAGWQVVVRKTAEPHQWLKRMRLRYILRDQRSRVRDLIGMEDNAALMRQ
jgi:hypothetical protein